TTRSADFDSFMEPMLIAEASRRIDRAAMNPENEGAVKLANYFVGQIVGSMNESKSADRVVLEMVDEFIDAVTRVNDMMS
ncbi:MAG: nitronate monooxygenase, partial [Actinomycetota bacterium]